MPRRGWDAGGSRGEAFGCRIESSPRKRIGPDTLDNPSARSVPRGIRSEHNADRWLLLGLITEFCVSGVNAHAFTENCTNENGQN